VPWLKSLKAESVDTDRAVMAACLFAVDTAGLGGVLLQSSASDARDAWLRLTHDLLGSEVPWRRLPAHVDDARLLGGLDLAATLAAGRAVTRGGVLAEADGGVVVLAMAERVEVGTAARIAAVLDAGSVCAQREGALSERAARLGVVALDESEPGDARLPRVLSERLALHLRLEPASTLLRQVPEPDRDALRQAVARAHVRLPTVRASDEIITALCEAANTLGIDSLRACTLALRVACAAAALRGSDVVQCEDAAWAGCFVLGPRALAWPAGEDPVAAGDDAEPVAPDASEQDQHASAEPAPERATSPPARPDAQQASPDGDVHSPPSDAVPMDEAVVGAAAATLPPALLGAVAASMATPGSQRSGAGVASSGQPRLSFLRGRPVSARRGELRGGARLDLLRTLAAAAPWQPLRRRERALARTAVEGAVASGAGPAILLRRGDFHVRRFRMREESTTIFAVDASGSQALNRLAEAKGAAELLLADCYVRRDRVAVVAFRGCAASLLLPPTRSLVRAKRCLAGLPGGGATPLAAGIDAARQLAQGILQQGGTPLLVLLTDGKANMTHDGQPGRGAAQAEALVAARAWRGTGVRALLLDTAPEPQPRAREMASEMRARYVALPHADARALATAVEEGRRCVRGSGSSAPGMRALLAGEFVERL
jgi:magnesium chelatase subunit D